ncbi:MAG TPA: hypothetical protein VN958_11545 [Chitinophagaceae bacterium]|nr:hypothetical protein [Chitinophagaceae bacterium]
MKKIVFILSLLFLHNYFCVGQTQPDTSGDKIEGIKTTFMNKELNLTPEEAKKFWPVYNNYFKEIREARKNYGNDEVAFEEQVVEIRKKYKGNFRKILNSDDRANKVFVSEKNLRDLLKKELQNRQRLRRPPNQPPPRKRKN